MAHTVQVSEVNGRLQGNGGCELGRVELVERHGGNPADIQPFLQHRLGRELLDDRVERFVNQIAPPEHLLNDAAGRFALTEPGDGEAANCPAIRLIEIGLDVGVVQLYGENRFARLALLSGYLHTWLVSPPEPFRWGVLRTDGALDILARMTSTEKLNRCGECRSQVEGDTPALP